MMSTVARLLIVVFGAACLWAVLPGSASAASDCGGSGFRVGAAARPSDGVRTCNNYAANSARVLGGVAVAAAIGLAVLAYRRGARATRAAYIPDGQPPAGGPPHGQLPDGQPLDGGPPDAASGQIDFPVDYTS
jgi:hypothetical protein